MAGWFADRCIIVLPRPGRAVAYVLITLVVWVQAPLTPRYELQGFRQTVAKLNALEDRQSVLFGGQYDGPFILYRRLADPDLRTVTIRASKILGGGNILAKRDYKGFVDSPEQMQRRFAELGVSLVVLEEREEIEAPEHQWFWEYVQNGPFEKVATIPTRYPDRPDGALTIYRYTGQAFAVARIELPMLTLRKGEMTFDRTRSLLNWNQWKTEISKAR